MKIPYECSQIGVTLQHELAHNFEDRKDFLMKFPMVSKKKFLILHQSYN